MASQHIHKRPNLNAGSSYSQSPITSFFQSSPHFTNHHDPYTPTPQSSCHHQPYTLQRHSNSPPPPNIFIPALPPSVQSNLLSVGMRIRKSVPEGYKTGSSYSSFSLLTESPVSPRTVPVFRQSSGTGSSLGSGHVASGNGNGNGNGSHGMAPPLSLNSERKYGRARARELTPFCGLLKVGGLAMQEPGELDDVPPLSSQGSTTTVETNWSGDSGYCSWDGSAWTPALAMGGTGVGIGYGIGNKRRREEEAEEEEEMQRGDPRLRVPSSSVARSEGQERRFKVPRKPKRNVGESEKGQVWGQENMETDFGDADFLDYGLAAGTEVEMGGV